MKRKDFSIKTIFYSMLSTLLVLTLFVGFVVAEKNTRQIGFADNDPWFIYKDNKEEGHYMGFRFMGEIYKVDFTCIYNFTNDIANYINGHIEDTNLTAKNEQNG